MAEQGASIFNRKAAEKLRSPDDLDKYVRVTSPSVWVMLAACIALLFGLLVWGFYGTVSTNVSCKGVVMDGEAVCFLSAEDVVTIHEGDEAYVDGKKMQVAKVGRIPLSHNEVSNLLQSDYLVDSLVKEGDWATQVSLEGDVSSLETGVPLTVNITTERVAPISLILGD